MIIHVENKILAHDGQANQSNVSTVNKQKMFSLNMYSELV